MTRLSKEFAAVGLMKILIRIVLDLNEATHYKIHRWSNGGLEIEFNYQIGDFQFYRDANGIAKLACSGTAQPPFQSTSFHSPTPFVLGFSGHYLDWRI